MFSDEAISELFDGFRHKTILVLGDVMIDAYLFGRVDRISPEAPVPVVSLNKRENRLGGAANVALNLNSLGAKPLLCSVIGNDRQGDVFLSLMEAAGLSAEGMIRSRERITTTKFRVIGNNAQMLRVDEEHTHDLSGEEEEACVSAVRRLAAENRVDGFILQDYNKGLLTPVLITRIIALARELGIPVTVDPKKKNFEAYRNVTLFKPNLKELKDGLKLDFDHRDPVQLESAVTLLQQRQHIGMVMVTLSEAGVMIRARREEEDYEFHLVPAHKRSIADVSGAGDTVISIATLCLCSGCGPGMIASLSNLAGGLVCEEVGVVPVDRERLLQEAKTALLSSSSCQE